MRTETAMRATLLATGQAALPSGAQADLRTYVAGRIHHDTNIFAFSGEEEAVAQTGSDELADTVTSGIAGAQLTLGPAHHRFTATAEGRRYTFDQFSHLDHDEYAWSGLYDWHPGGWLGGKLEYRQEQRMAAFADRDASLLTLEHERSGGGRLDFELGANWLLQAGARALRLESPLPARPAFELDENAGTLALRYRGSGRTSVGLDTEYLDGEFRGGVTPEPFEQITAESALDYKLSGLSELHARLGYTRREEHDGDRIDGITGSLGAQRALTGVTAVQAEVFRRVSSYVGGPDSVIETGARAGLAWRPTLKFSVDIGAEWVDSEFQAAPLPGGEQRDDRALAGFVRIAYEPWRWLRIQPFTEYRDRDSSLELESYDSTIVGLELRAQFGGPLSPGPGGGI
jgi:hypothetical protein